MDYIVLTAGLLHLIICALLWVGIQGGVLSLHKYVFFIALLLPLWGILIAIILQFQIALKTDNTTQVKIGRMKLESELYRSVTIDEKRADTTIPIEEALLINSARERRSLIMEVLNEDPGEYVEFLQKAGNNDDTEVVHYAVTAMVEISKENDYMLQKLESEYRAAPNDRDILTRYSDFLWNCLSQKLMQGQVEVMNRDLFSQLMREKMEYGDNIEDYARLATNELKRKRYDETGEVIRVMGEKWPGSEEYILLNIEYLAALHKGKEIHAFIERLKNEHVYLSSKAKEAIAFWVN